MGLSREAPRAGLRPEVSPAAARSWSGCSLHMPGTLSKVPTWVAGTKSLNHHRLCPRDLSRKLGLKPVTPGLSWLCCNTGTQIYPCDCSIAFPVSSNFTQPSTDAHPSTLSFYCSSLLALPIVTLQYSNRGPSILEM